MADPCPVSFSIGLYSIHSIRSEDSIRRHHLMLEPLVSEEIASSDVPELKDRL